MRVSDFFREEEDPGWDLKGVDPWKRIRMVLDTGAIDRIRSGPLESAADPEASYTLAQLAHEELVAYGTDGSQRLDDAEIAAVLRSLRAVHPTQSGGFHPAVPGLQGLPGVLEQQRHVRSWRVGCSPRLPERPVQPDLLGD